jgi:hypothetical protein
MKHIRGRPLITAIITVKQTMFIAYQLLFLLCRASDNFKARKWFQWRMLTALKLLTIKWPQIFKVHQ